MWREARGAAHPQYGKEKDKDGIHSSRKYLGLPTQKS